MGASHRTLFLVLFAAVAIRSSPVSPTVKRQASCGQQRTRDWIEKVRNAIDSLKELRYRADKKIESLGDLATQGNLDDRETELKGATVTVLGEFFQYGGLIFLCQPEGIAQNVHLILDEALVLLEKLGDALPDDDTRPVARKSEQSKKIQDPQMKYCIATLKPKFGDDAAAKCAEILGGPAKRQNEDPRMKFCIARLETKFGGDAAAKCSEILGGPAKRQNEDPRMKFCIARLETKFGGEAAAKCTEILGGPVRRNLNPKQIM